jgi:alanine racemase
MRIGLRHALKSASIYILRMIQEHRSLRTWAEINRSALRHNVRQIRLTNPGRELIGVIKANAYGHGLEETAGVLAREGVRIFAVATLDEALRALRCHRAAKALLLSPLLPEEMKTVVGNPRIIPVVSTRSEIHSLSSLAKRLRKRCQIHIKIDTGMGRLGAFPAEAFDLLDLSRKSAPHLLVTGVLTHLSSADVSADFTARQCRIFELFCRQLASRGWKIPMIHFQNSAGSVRLSKNDVANAFRPGLALYGVPVPPALWTRELSKVGALPLRPVLTWKARIAIVRDFPKGATVSYGATWTTPKPSRIAVLAVGYADGVFRKLSNRGEVLIKGKRCPIVGRVTMDMVLVDVSRIPGAKAGDVAVLIGRDGRTEITASEFAEWAETSPYEVLCHIGSRVKRVGMGKS